MIFFAGLGYSGESNDKFVLWWKRCAIPWQLSTSIPISVLYSRQVSSTYIKLIFLKMIFSHIFSFIFIIEHVMPLCMAFSWVYSVSMLVQSIVYEKEQRLKEVMKTMGLNSLVHWLAWFITSFVQMSITAAILTIILKYGKVLTYSNPVIIFLYIEVFVVANIVFS